MKRVIFPLQLKANGQPYKRQEHVYLCQNGTSLCISRGEIVEVPDWVPRLCGEAVWWSRGKAHPIYECFVSIASEAGCNDKRSRMRKRPNAS